jgi:pimeloyl-ACP methyl ester carboxylesterase
LRNENEQKMTIYVGDIELYCQIRGSGRAVLLLHGWGQSLSVFVDIERYLSTQYQVILLDSRDHGQSGSGEKAPTIPLMAEDAQKALHSLDIERVFIIGYSDGGNLALQMAFSYPDLVAGFAAISANAFPSGLNAPFRFCIHFWRALLSLLVRAGIVKRRAIDLLNLLLEWPQLSLPDLQRIKAPCLLIYGQRDIVSPQHRAALGSALPRSRTITIPGATHFSILRKWETQKKGAGYMKDIEVLLKICYNR